MPQAAIANLVGHAAEEIALVEASLEQQAHERIRRALPGSASGTAVVPMMTRTAFLELPAVRLQLEPMAKSVPAAHRGKAAPAGPERSVAKLDAAKRDEIQAAAEFLLGEPRFADDPGPKRGAGAPAALPPRVGVKR